MHGLETRLLTRETQDGAGAGDHDQPYRFGRRPCAGATYPFSTRQFARLLILRSRAQAGLVGEEIGPGGAVPVTTQESE